MSGPNVPCVCSLLLDIVLLVVGQIGLKGRDLARLTTISDGGGGWDRQA